MMTMKTMIVPLNNNKLITKTYLIPFIRKSSSSRSFVTLRKNADHLRSTVIDYKKIYLTLPLVLTITKRFTGGKHALNTAKTCIGSACEPFVTAAQNSSSTTSASTDTTNTSTTPANNAAAELLNNPNTTSPAVSIITIIQPEPPVKPTAPAVHNNTAKEMLDKMPNVIKTGKVLEEKQTTPSKLDSIKQAMKDGSGSWVNLENSSTKEFPQAEHTTPGAFDASKKLSLSSDNNHAEVPVDSSYSNITSPSFSEDSENIKEIETLIETALNMDLLVRRDAPDNPGAGSEHLTVKGNSVYKGLQIKEEPKLSKNPIDLSKANFQTGMLSVDEKKTLAPRSDQLHPVISTHNGKMYAWGYLTSHNGDGTLKIADKQMDGAKTSDGKDKPQFYVPFAQPIEVSPENFTRNYEGDTYLQDSAIRDQLSFYNSKASKYEPIPHKEVGLTKEDLEAMVAQQAIDDAEKAFKEAKKPSNFLEDDKKKKQIKKDEAAQKNQEKQKKKSQDDKDKAKLEAENKLKSFNNDQ
jgi:hypothetical protein